MLAPCPSSGAGCDCHHRGHCMITVGTWGSVFPTPSSDEQRKGNFEFPVWPVLWAVAPDASSVFRSQNSAHPVVHFGQSSRSGQTSTISCQNEKQPRRLWGNHGNCLLSRDYYDFIGKFSFSFQMLQSSLNFSVWFYYILELNLCAAETLPQVSNTS